MHGLQGLLVGLIARSRPGNIGVSIVAGVVGTAVMVGGYLAGGVVIAGFGPSLLDIPGNCIQGGVGVVLGILVAAAVGRAYPPVRHWTW